MGDIFDRLTGNRDEGDIFDRLAPKTVADQARARLASRGLTPEMVKAGQTSAPGEMREASWMENAKARGAHMLTQIPASLFSAVTAPAEAVFDFATLGPARRYKDSNQSGWLEAVAATASPFALPTLGRDASVVMPDLPITKGINDAANAAGDALQQKMGVPPEAITDTSEAQGVILGDIASLPVGGAAKAGAGAVTAPARRALATRGADRLTNSLLKPTEADFRFAANPADGARGVTAWSMRGMGDELGAKVAALDNELQRVLSTSPAGDVIDVERVINTAIDDAVKTATELGDDAAIGRLDRLRAARLNATMAITGNRRLVNPAEAHALKKQTDELINKWAEDLSDTSTRDALQDIYRAYDAAIDAVVPEAERLNREMANAIVAKRAAQRQFRHGQRSDISANPLSWIGEIVNSTGVKSHAADYLRRLMTP